MIQRIFVYGTLLPGQSRWQFLRPCVVDEGQPTTVEGELFDTGLGYPAAVFAGDGRVHGRLFQLVADRLHESLAAIDLVEHTADEYYRRVVVHTEAGQSAWAYEYTGPPAYTPIARGSWLDHVTG